MKKVLILLIMFLSGLAAADDISFTASANKNTVALNDSFVYSVTVSINGSISNIPEPQMGDLSNFNRFASGKSQSMSIINGKASGSVSYNYTLGPKTIGHFTIPAAKVVYNNKTYTTQPIEIEVVPAQSVQSGAIAASQRQSQQIQQAQQRRARKADIFVKGTVNKKTVYENEKLVYKFSFYTNVDLASNPDYVQPDFNGFWNDGVQPKNHLETINSMQYLVNELETTLYPISSGVLTISPAKLKVEFINFSAPDNADDLMQAFFAMAGGQPQTKLLETSPIKITVLPLPKEGRPNDFYGAVGKFKISASVDKTDVETNEPITLVLTVSGDGNMKSVTRFDIAANNGLKKYDTIVSNSNDNMKVFTTLITALTPGEKVIPPIRLSYFNPASKKYETVYTEPIKLNVTGQPVLSSQILDDSEFGGIGDISYNKPINNLKSWNSNYIENKKFYLLFVPFMLLLIGGFMFNFFGKSKSKGSISKAHKQIKSAEEDLTKGNLGGLFDSIYRALIEAIDSKTGVSSEGLQEKQILERLKDLDVAEEAINKLSIVFERINLYKFASVRADEKTLKEMLENVKEIIDQLG